MLEFKTVEMYSFFNVCGLLFQSSEVKQVLQNQEKNKGLIAAICAGPTALHAHGIAKGITLTSHPSVKDKFGSGSSELDGFYSYICHLD